MLQQTAAEKSHHGRTFLEGLSAGQTDRREHQKVLNYMSEDYSTAMRVAANLSSHGKWIPYPFLTNRLKAMADEVREQAEVFRVGLVRLGGTVPQVTADDREDVDFRQNVKRLVHDMEEHGSLSEILIHQKNDIRDQSVIKLLESVISVMQREKDELLDIVMRLS